MWQECALTTGFALPHLIKCFGKQSSSALTSSEAAQFSLAIWISFVSLTYWDFFLMAITFFFFMKEVGEICGLCSLQQWIHPSQKPSLQSFCNTWKSCSRLYLSEKSIRRGFPIERKWLSRGMKLSPLYCDYSNEIHFLPLALAAYRLLSRG